MASPAWAVEPARIVPDHSVPPGIWHPDQGDGTYINPILAGDYSDPDAIRVGADYYLVSSSFTNVPGLPILQSKDLVNWQLIGHALPRIEPAGHYVTARHGAGVWAPTIRYRNGRFMVFFPDPDFGIFMVSASDPKGPWTKPVLVDATRGAIDPCPFWDDDGKAYLVYAFANSRAGISNKVAIKDMAPDGTHTTGQSRIIIDADGLPKVQTSRGLMPWFTTEGPKIYKRKGWYYIFAPAGSVKGGWQGVFRSRNINGPYKGRDAMDQGETTMNGPHQGAWVNTQKGEDWFLHFQDTDTYGRRVMLEPMRWGADDWPVIGTAGKVRSIGQPVWRYRKPDLPVQPVSVPIIDDDFADGFHLGWQWNANPGSDWIDGSVKGKLRLKSISSSANLWEAGNILAQKLPGADVTATVKVDLAAAANGERAGLIILASDYGWVGLEKTGDGARIVQVTRKDANLGSAETVLTAPQAVTGPVWLRIHLEPVTVAQPEPQFDNYWPSMLRATFARANFSYSLDGESYTAIGPGFIAPPGRWTGAQIGIFGQAASGTPAYVSPRVGYSEFKDFSMR